MLAGAICEIKVTFVLSGWPSDEYEHFANLTIMQFAVPAADDAQRLSRVALKQPLLKAVRYWIQLRLFQFLLKVALWRRKQPASEAPTYSKAYSVRPHLPVRVFIPPSYKPGNSKPLPLHIG